MLILKSPYGERSIKYICMYDNGLITVNIEVKFFFFLVEIFSQVKIKIKLV